MQPALLILRSSHQLLGMGHKPRSFSVQFSPSVVSDSLQPHGLQHARPPYCSPSPGACSSSCPSNWWCHLTISSSVMPFSSCLQSFSASGSFFQWVRSSHQVAKVSFSCFCRFFDSLCHRLWCWIRCIYHECPLRAKMSQSRNAQGWSAREVNVNWWKRKRSGHRARTGRGATCQVSTPAGQAACPLVAAGEAPFSLQCRPHTASYVSCSSAFQNSSPLGGSDHKWSACKEEAQARSLGQEGPLRRKWQPTPGFLPGESHGQRRLAGYRVGHNWVTHTYVHTLFVSGSVFLKALG